MTHEDVSFQPQLPIDGLPQETTQPLIEGGEDRSRIIAAAADAHPYTGEEEQTADRQPTVQESLGGQPHELSLGQQAVLGSIGQGGKKAARAFTNREEDLAKGRTGPVEKTPAEKAAMRTAIDQMRRAAAPVSYDALVAECKRPDGTVDNTRLSALAAKRADDAYKRREQL